jgi:ABC-type lipoprotein release transport system permease subunit
MGISKFTINKFILKESLLICIFGLVLGIIIGIIGSYALNQYIISTYTYIPANLRITVITPLLIIQITTITLIIALLASLAPSYWASKLKPADTIRDE